MGNIAKNQGTQNNAEESAQESAILSVEKENQSGEKTFTQEEVDEIIKHRLNRERSKAKATPESFLPDDLKKRIEEVNEREANLIKRERKFDILEKLRRDNLPEALADYLDYSDDKNLTKSYNGLKDLFSKNQTSIDKPVGFQKVGADTPNEINSKSDPIRNIFKL